MAKSVARQLATAALWVRIQTSLKNRKWATKAKEWPTHSSPPKKYSKKKQIMATEMIVSDHRDVSLSMTAEDRL